MHSIRSSESIRHRTPPKTLIRIHLATACFHNNSHMMMVSFVGRTEKKGICTFHGVTWEPREMPHGRTAVTVETLDPQCLLNVFPTKIYYVVFLVDYKSWMQRINFVSENRAATARRWTCNICTVTHTHTHWLSVCPKQQFQWQHQETILPVPPFFCPHKPQRNTRSCVHCISNHIGLSWKQLHFILSLYIFRCIVDALAVASAERVWRKIHRRVLWKHMHSM